MDLSEKATESPDVTLAGDLLESAYEVSETELVGADDVTPEGEFPQYGDFLPVQEFSPYDGTDRGETYIEVPQALAQLIIEEELADGTRWKVIHSRKVDGEWKFEIEEIGSGNSET